MSKQPSNVPPTIAHAIRPKPITHCVNVGQHKWQVFTQDGRVENWIFKSGQWMMVPFSTSTKPKKHDD